MEKKSRKTKDELELLKLIIQDNPLLFTRVINRIKEQIATSNESVFSSAKQKHDMQKRGGSKPS